jgi:hypothetical protein
LSYTAGQLWGFRIRNWKSMAQGGKLSPASKQGLQEAPAWLEPLLVNLKFLKAAALLPLMQLGGGKRSHLQKGVVVLLSARPRCGGVACAERKRTVSA